MDITSSRYLVKILCPAEEPLTPLFTFLGQPAIWRKSGECTTVIGCRAKTSISQELWLKEGIRIP